MKRCPSCKRVFADDSLTVCTDDGSILISEGAVSFDPRFPSTEGYRGIGGKATWSASQDDIPKLQQYLTAVAEPKRRVWRWIAALAAALFIIIIVLALFILHR